MSFSVLLLDNVDSVCKHVFEQRGIKAVQPGTLTLEELNACIGEYDGLVVRSATKVTLNFCNMPQNSKLLVAQG